jgi:alanine dehydrogenase
LTKADVEALMDPDDLLEAVAAALRDLSAGRASMPNRIAVAVPERDALLAAMPARLPSAAALTTKLVSVFPRNTDRPTHQAVLVSFDPEDGTPTALMDATAITEWRTAAGSALSTRLLARDDAQVLAVLGTGVQARAHVRAVARVRAFERIVVAGRDRGKADALAASVARDVAVPLDVAGSFEDAVRAADVVCAATHADAPVVLAAWLRPGTHVASVGFNPAGEGEVDRATVAGAAVFVESRASALAPPPSGAVELTRAIAEGSIGEGHVRAEIGQVLSGDAPGRTTDDEITLYKSVGVAVEDAAAAALVLRRATKRRLGLRIEL